MITQRRSKQTCKSKVTTCCAHPVPWRGNRKCGDRIVDLLATMTPTQEIPIPSLTAGATSPTGSASATLTYDDANIAAGGSLQTSMMWADSTSPALMAHIHAIADPLRRAASTTVAVVSAPC